MMHEWRYRAGCGGARYRVIAMESGRTRDVMDG